jgi:hypothetical protein
MEYAQPNSYCLSALVVGLGAMDIFLLNKVKCAKLFCVGIICLSLKLK